MEKEKAREKERGREDEKIQQVFTNIEKKVDLKASQIKEARIAVVQKKKDDFEVDEKAVVLALNLSEALGKKDEGRALKALDGWGRA